ncbi:MAG: alpha/beta fold hydrolase [Planctomycetota bacterium]
MYLIAVIAGIASAATFVLLLLIAILRHVLGSPRPGLFRRTLWWALALVPVHVTLTVPATMGWFGSRMVGTRGDERAYLGPRFDADGNWVHQDRDTLKAEARPADAPPPPESPFAVHFASVDGVTLRAFVVEPRQGEPRATVILVHGLFRGAMEIETPGAMFRDLGCEVVLLELRNHGGSGRAPATFGFREANDVLAAVDFVRKRPGAAGTRPLILFGVSLGTAAIGFAAPKVEHLAGIVVDAPLADAVATAHRMLRDGPRGRAGFTMPQPFRSLALTALEWWSDIDLSADRPGDSLARVAPTVPILVIGGGDDHRMLPDEVRALFARLPQDASHKELWIREGADHGDVWKVDPKGYREHLAAFLSRALSR